MKSQSDESPVVLPLGRCVDDVAQHVSSLVLDTAVLIWRGAVDALPCSDGHLLLIALDGKDEAHLDDVHRAATRWRAHNGGPIVVFYALSANGEDGARREHLCRLANRWNVCVVDVGNPRDLAPSVGALCELMFHQGVIGLDRFDVATVTAPPSIARYSSAAYEPGAVGWAMPPSWLPSVAQASAVLMSVRVTKNTSLVDISTVCQAVADHVAPAGSVLVGAPDAMGAPMVTLIAIERAASTSQPGTRVGCAA